MAIESASQDLFKIVTLLGAAVVMVPIFRRIGLGSVLGYLVAGLIVGPFGMKWFTDPGAILHVAELGVVMFLFVIGLEMRPAHLWSMRKDIFGLGAFQIVACTILLTLLGYVYGLSLPVAFIGGMGFVLTSTAIVMQILGERGDFVSRYGKENPFEDFAESVSAYRLNPSLLKQRSKAKYDYIKYYVFDGLEYDSAKSCNNDTGIKKYQTLIDQNKFPFTEQEQKDIQSACQLDFYNHAFGNGYQSTFNSCVNFEASDIWLKKVSDKHKEISPSTVYDRDFGLSNLKFTALIHAVAQSLTEESTDWLINELSRKSYKFRGSMDINSYCEVWGDLKNSSYPSNYGQTKWRKNYYAPVKALYTDRPNSGKIISMCKEISQAHAPSSNSSKSAIKSFISTVSIVTSREILTDKNLTREIVLDAIAAKTIPKK